MPRSTVRPRRAPARPRRAVRPGAAADRVRQALEDNDQVDRLSRMFRALGDPTRSRVVYALSIEELCVSELAEVLGSSMSAVSHQLRILRDLEIVHVRRDGKSQRYALNEQAFGFCSPRTCHAWKQTLTPTLTTLSRP